MTVFDRSSSPSETVTFGVVRARRGVGVRRVLLGRVGRAVVLEVPAVGQRVLVGVGRRRREVDLQRGEADRRRRRDVARAPARRSPARRRLAARARRRPRSSRTSTVPPGLLTPSVNRPKRRRRHAAFATVRRPPSTSRRRASTRPSTSCPVLVRRSQTSVVPGGHVDLRLRVLDRAVDLRPQLDPVDRRLAVVGDDVELDVVVVVPYGQQAALLVAAAQRARRPSSRSPSRRRRGRPSAGGSCGSPPVAVGRCRRPPS